MKALYIHIFVFGKGKDRNGREGKKCNNDERKGKREKDFISIRFLFLNLIVHNYELFTIIIMRKVKVDIHLL